MSGFNPDDALWRYGPSLDVVTAQEHLDGGGTGGSWRHAEVFQDVPHHYNPEVGDMYRHTLYGRYDANQHVVTITGKPIMGRIPSGLLRALERRWPGAKIYDDTTGSVSFGNNWYKKLKHAQSIESPFDYGHDWFDAQYRNEGKDSSEMTEEKMLEGFNPKDAIWEFRDGSFNIVTAKEWWDGGHYGYSFTHENVFGSGEALVKGRYDAKKNVVTFISFGTHSYPSSLRRWIDRAWPGARVIFWDN